MTIPERTWTRVTPVCNGGVALLDPAEKASPLPVAIRENRAMAARELALGDRVIVHGSYGFEPDWLAASGERGGYDGRVVDFIPGQNEKPAAVIDLDAEIVLPDGAGTSVGKEVRGRFLVLELAWVDHAWDRRPTRVTVELCDFRPEPSRWQDRRQGAWVESHATYEIVDEAINLPMKDST